MSRIYTELGQSPNAVEQAALKSQGYDTAIGQLESRTVGGRFKVRKALADVLSPKTLPPAATVTHDALLTLSHASDGHCRLITTNFDRLFEDVIHRRGLQIEKFCAPLLPVPKRRWDGLVYLHGLLPATATQSDLDRLVVSSGDFGLAYLTERWAARFVSELFRNYIVCFVGYSINDPVLRYMMDALAADRMLGEAPAEMFAFGNYQRSKEEHAANEWRAKNVTPILYRNHNKHAHLHKTLRAWAETYRDGVRGKESIVIRHALSKPMGSTRQDDFVGRMVWALSHPSGLPAKRFAEMNPVPPIEWLDTFTETRFEHRDLSRFGITPSAEEDGKLSFSLVSRPAGFIHAPWMRLIQRSFDRYTRWDEVMTQIARWLLRHLDDPHFLLWAASQGDELHNQFAYLLQDALKGTRPSPPMLKLWRLILAGRVHTAFGRGSLYDWVKQLAEEGLTPLLRLRLRELLAPRVKLRRRFEWPSGDVGEGTAPKSKDSVRDLVDWEIVLATDFPHSALQHNTNSEAWKNALPHLLPDATELLRDALDLMAALQGADPRSDGSQWHQPSIKPHAQNRTHRDWTALIELARDTWLASAEVSADRAVLEVNRWLDIAYPVFRRLAFFAVAERPELFPSDYGRNLLLVEDAWWLWSVETQRETFLLLSSVAQRSPKNNQDLQSAILAGPPRDMFVDDLEQEKFERISDREIWRRLTTFRDAGGNLISDAASTLDRLSKAYPDWQAATERDHFPVWIESGSGWRKYTTVPVSRAELTEWLREHPHVDDLHHEDDWSERCRNDFPRTAAALIALAKKGDWPVGRWRQALQTWSEAELVARSWRHLAPVLHNADDDFVFALRHQLAWWLKAVARQVNLYSAVFFTLAGRVLSAADGAEEEQDDDHDLITQAINHPVGLIAEAILERWYASELEDDQGLTGTFLEFFDRLASSGRVYRHSRVLLCANIISLYRVDRQWTEVHLLPLFDWQVSQITSLRSWKSFLWSARLYWPLLDALHDSFLQTAAHYSLLGEHAERYATLLTYAALEQTNVFSRKQLAAATMNLPVEGLEIVARTLTDALESADSKKPEQWRNRVKPYLKHVWPQSKNVLVPSISSELAKLAIATGSEFADAVDMLQDWFLQSEDIDFTLHRLSEACHPTNFPEVSLQLISCLVPDNLTWPVQELRDCLVAIRNAQPDLMDDGGFLRLEMIVRQKGLAL